MLSYRHAFHAGNHADVLKHLVLCICLDYLKKKDKPFCYHDTHGGGGSYPFKQAMMQKNSEFTTGIAKLLEPQKLPQVVADYVNAVKACNPSGKVVIYPGSPLLAYHQLRAQDRMQVTELHPADAKALTRLFAEKAHVKVSQQDAWQGLKAWLPPQQRRGLVLIDPPYELKQEYRDVITGLQDAYRRFATGTYAIWYPVLERQHCEQFMRQLARTEIPAMLRIELSITDDLAGRGMTGSGMVVINPPWTLAETMKQTLPWLKETLQYQQRGHYRLEWLMPAP